MSSIFRFSAAVCTVIISGNLLYAQGIVYQKFEPDLVELSETQKEKLKLFFSNIKRTRDDVYGNVHAKFDVIETEKTEKGTKNRKVRYEFWSRDHIFFRADSEVIASDEINEIGSRRKMIVRPEGAATFLSKTTGMPFLLENMEPPESGYYGFTAMPFYQSSTLLNYLSGVSLVEILFLKKVNSVTKTLIKLDTEEDPAICAVICTSTGPPYEVTLSFDIDRGICLALKGIKKEGAKQIHTREVVNDYDHDKFRQIPARHFEKYESLNERVSKTLEVITISADFEPVSMDVFSVPSATPEKGMGIDYWVRRLFVFIVGTILFVAFLIHRFFFKRA